MTVVETKIGKLHIIGTEQVQGPSGVTSNNEEQSRGFEAIPDQEKANVEISFVLEIVSTMSSPWSLMACQSPTW